jgi:TatD DNase family protein
MTARPFEIVDVHAHLCDPVFDSDREDVLRRARAAGVRAIVGVGETLSDGKRNLELARSYPELMPAAGLFPEQLDLDQVDAVISLIREECSRVVCIGEVGLDYWIVKDEKGREIQRAIFRRFIDLSLELGLPLNVHSRSAGRHVVALLLESGARKAQLHAFDGKVAAALPAVEAGYFFSVPPSVVRSRQKQKLVKELPLSSLLLETDSPVLGPRTGERNEPCNATISLNAIAEIKGLEIEDVAEALWVNTHILYENLTAS